MNTLNCRILIIAVLVVTALLGRAGVAGAEPSKPDPELTLKTTAIYVRGGDSVTTTAYKEAPIFFANDGAGVLAWRFYIGSDIAGCAVESASTWLTVRDNGKPVLYGPGAASATARVALHDLTPGGYSALICMESNDRDEYLLAIPVTVEIE
jgi:hypothetical protein